MRWPPLRKIFLVTCMAAVFQILPLAGFLETPLLANEKHIYAVTEPWPPYMGPKLMYNGFLPEVLLKAFDKVGYTVTVEFRPWAKAVEHVKKGKSNILCGAYYTEEREEFLAYSQPIAEVQDVLFMKKGRNITFQKLAEGCIYD